MFYIKPVETAVAIFEIFKILMSFSIFQSRIFLFNFLSVAAHDYNRFQRSAPSLGLLCFQKACQVDVDDNDTRFVCTQGQFILVAAFLLVFYNTTSCAFKKCSASNLRMDKEFRFCILIIY
jgi:hypothetical protein